MLICAIECLWNNPSMIWLYNSFAEGCDLPDFRRMKIKPIRQFLTVIRRLPNSQKNWLAIRRGSAVF